MLPLPGGRLNTPPVEGGQAARLSYCVTSSSPVHGRPPRGARGPPGAPRGPLSGVTYGGCMRVVIEWWYVRRMVRRCEGWCVMRYMDQVRVDGFGSGEVLVEVSMGDLVALRRLLDRLLAIAEDGVEPVYVRDREDAVRFVMDLERIHWSAADDLYDVV
jgi:hypothetical protein